MLCLDGIDGLVQLFPLMKLASVAFLAGVCSTAAFLAPAPIARPATVMMAAERAPSRREVLSKAMGGLGLLGVVGLMGAAPARAGWLNSDSLPEVIKPQDAVIDQDILGSSDVQSELKNIKEYREKVVVLQRALTSDAQTDLTAKIRDAIDYAALRDSLNKVNSVFSEDTQRGTDRLVRIILQDVSELEAAARKRPGVDRSDKKVVSINKKLTKLTGAFDELLTYF